MLHKERWTHLFYEEDEYRGHPDSNLILPEKQRPDEK